MDRLKWALSKIAARVETNRAWRPKHPKTFRPWIRKTVSDELVKIDGEDQSHDDEIGTHVDTSAMVSQLSRNAKTLR